MSEIAQADTATRVIIYFWWIVNKRHFYVDNVVL